MTSLSFTIPGPPHGKGRPRATRFGKGIRLYTDAKTASYESLVAYAAQQALEGRAPLSGSLVVSVLVRLAPPASTSRKNAAAMLVGDIRPTKKPDLDNVLKSILDGLNGVAFGDDAQVCWINAGKVYAVAAGVDVTISAEQPVVLRAVG